MNVGASPDTAIRKGQKGALVTLAERRSRYALAHVLEGKEENPVTKRITSLLHPHKAKVHTITFDNGKEFAHHAQIARALKADISSPIPTIDGNEDSNRTPTDYSDSISPGRPTLQR